MNEQFSSKSQSPLFDLIPENRNRVELTELHVHLGGAVPIYRLWEMGIQQGIRGMADSYEDFISRLHRSIDNAVSLDQFLEIFDLVEMIQSGPKSVAESIGITLNGAYRTGGMRRLGPGGEGGDPSPICAVTKLELRFNPMKRSGAQFSKDGITGLYDVDKIIRFACESVEDSEIAYRGAFHAGLLFCFGRDMSWEANRILAEKINNWKKVYSNIIGIDLAGPESVRDFSNPADIDKLAELYEICSEGLGRTIHLGETRYTTVDIFVNLVKAIKPNRVSHPIAAVRAYWENKDSRALEILAENKITCELCVYSNFATKAITNVSEYQKLLSTLDSFEIPYAFSTDSPALQMTTIAGEIEYLMKHGALSVEQAKKAINNSDKASFLYLTREFSID